jgi:lipoprotein NlpD
MTTRNLIHFTALAAVLACAGCATRSPAPVDDRRPSSGAAAKPAAPAAAAPAPAPASAPAAAYVVKRGDTLYSIALEHGVDFRDLARWNNLDDPSKLRLGQTLQVRSPEAQGPTQASAVRAPGAVESRPLEMRPLGPDASPPAAASGATKSGPTAQRLPYSDQNLAQLQRGDAVASAKPAAPAAAGKPEAPKPAPASGDGADFIWPAKGTVIAGFSEPRVKGIDISGKVGDPVVAAAAGKVIYVGSGIPGLGKFVVIKHNEELSTVYAHAREVLVKMDQNVVRGQRIAELGDSDADRPKLHFQVRKSGKPLDPMGYLPPG